MVILSISLLWILFLLRLGDSQTSITVGQLDAQLLGLLDDFDAFTSTHIMGNFSSVRLGLHNEHFQVFKIIDENLSQAVWQDMLGGFARTITNLRHRQLSLETTSDSIINTLGLSPSLLNGLVTVRLVSLELLGSFLDNYRL